MKSDSVVYDLRKTFQENLLEGPFFTGAIPGRIIPPRNEWKMLFDYAVMTPLGVPACPFVVNSRGVQLASDLGFDVITWKTIRSTATQARPFPQVSFLEYAPILSFDQKMITTRRLSKSFADFAYTVSIGNASHELDIVLEDMRMGVQLIKPGQILITSIYGVGDTRQELIDDFVYLAVRVKEVGVHVIEANLSCPNVDGLLYKDPELVFALCSAIVKAIGTTPLTIKLGIFDSRQQMETILAAAARAGVRGITGINAIGMDIVTQQGEPFFPGRTHAGVCGAPIRPFALQFIRDARALSDAHGYAFTILGCGGITLPEHIDLFFDVGADAALSGAAALYNPYLMNEYAYMHFSQQSFQEIQV